jgi:hypothetical protein
MTTVRYLDWTNLRAQVDRAAIDMGAGFVTRLRAYRVAAAAHESQRPLPPQGDHDPGANARNLAAVLRLRYRVSHTR